MRSAMFDLGGKVVLITGASKGIGRAIAEVFVDHGATVCITAREQANAEAAAAEINARAGRESAFGFAADIHDLPTMIAAHDAVATRFGRVDVLVCNAAATTHSFGEAASFPLDEHASMMQANIVNNVALMSHAAVAMKERRAGVILATSSASGVRPAFGVFPYGVSKAGLNFAVRALAAEYAPFNVRVNAVAPGLTWSWSLREALKENPEAIERFKAMIPLGRIVEPEEIAAGMLLLASDAGRSITGQVLAIDGGEPQPGNS